MRFELESGRQILERTPPTLASLVRGLPDAWVRQDEGPDTWTVFDVLGHLVHGERTDWIPRARLILDHGPSRPFEPFDRFAQFEQSRGKSLDTLVDEFGALRAESLAALDALQLGPEDLAREGRHPALGVVTLGQHLSTWVAHDLDHVVQIARVMARCYADEVGPWRAYLRVLQPQASRTA
jgi:DinB superfamily